MAKIKLLKNEHETMDEFWVRVVEHAKSLDDRQPTSLLLLIEDEQIEDLDYGNELD